MSFTCPDAKISQIYYIHLFIWTKIKPWIRTIWVSFCQFVASSELMVFPSRFYLFIMKACIRINGFSLKVLSLYNEGIRINCFSLKVKASLNSTCQRYNSCVAFEMDVWLLFGHWYHPLSLIWNIFFELQKGLKRFQRDVVKVT